MLLANCFRVHDAFAFLDAFMGAVAAARDWELDYIKFDYGFQFVYVKYTGRKFQGQGLLASTFAPLSDPTLVHVTIHADEWPTHLHWDESAKRLVRPLIMAAHKASCPKLRVIRPRSARRKRVAAVLPQPRRLPRPRTREQVRPPNTP